MARRKTRSADLPEPVRRDGALCAAFVNSASPQRPGFEDYGELLAWCRHHGAASDASGERLANAAGEDPERAAATVVGALRLRTLLGRVFAALADRRTISAGDLEALDGARLEALSATRLAAADEGAYRVTWTAGDDLERVLRPIVVSAVDVLTSRYARKVRRCGGEDCDLLFVDRTSGSPRKWCSEETCGTRSRSSKYYRKTVKPQRQAWRRRAAAKSSGETSG